MLYNYAALNPSDCNASIYMSLTLELGFKIAISLYFPYFLAIFVCKLTPFVILVIVFSSFIIGDSFHNIIVSTFNSKPHQVADTQYNERDGRRRQGQQDGAA